MHDFLPLRWLIYAFLYAVKRDYVTCKPSIFNHHQINSVFNFLGNITLNIQHWVIRIKNIVAMGVVEMLGDTP